MSGLDNEAAVSTTNTLKDRLVDVFDYDAFVDTLPIGLSACPFRFSSK
jgi:hypothetical protein